MSKKGIIHTTLFSRRQARGYASKSDDFCNCMTCVFEVNYR